MPIDRLSLIGAGGHAAVVADAASLSGWTIAAVYSEDAAQAGQRLFDHVIAILEADTAFGPFHVAIGNNGARARLYEWIGGRGGKAATIAHPQAAIAASAEVGPGSFVAAGAVLAPRCTIGKGVIVNHRAVVDHDVSVGDYSHVAPGATLGGGVSVASQVLIGAGATILPRVKVGAGAVIGAGAVVLGDVPAGQTFVGVPAQSIPRGE